ncbi:hypothetical protein RPMA_26355 [Tardiphaga alba]|uniref:DUF4760 domain-containing protein n=1 Tax=Tardiphaga alba TaxID=340268 RepID=A0ABX8AGB7_9BRAD|nr:hypothetical protein [Tardiphaga alba]QUS41966.1 hypothetical protein RPMA_26355 [Tardiphaga alba]
MLDEILKSMTLFSVIIGAIAIYTALRTNNRRLGADIFLRYAERISDLRQSLPDRFLFEDDERRIEMTSRERRVIREVIYSIFELYELKIHGFIPRTIWTIWEPDIERLLTLPAFRQELTALRVAGIAKHPRFETWVARHVVTR